MRFLALGLAAYALLLVVPVPRSPAWAEEEAEAGALDERLERKLKGKLRSRASTWWSRRKQLAMRCPQCKGAGQVWWKRGRRRARVDCPKCDGNKLFVDKDRYRCCFYEMKSPAFRLQEGIRARVSSEFVQAQEGKPFPVVLERYSIRDVEIVDATHGIVHVRWNKDSVARPQRWIWADEARKPATWYVYDAEADGPWPGEAPPAEAPPPETVAPRPVPVAPQPAPRPPVPPVPEPDPPPPPPDPEVPRDEYEQSLVWLEKWTNERNDMEARVIRIEIEIDKVEGHEEKIKTARKFLAEVKKWLEEVKPAYERASEEIGELQLGVRMPDRVDLNVTHVKAHRRIKLVEDMLIGVLPDLRD